MFGNREEARLSTGKRGRDDQSGIAPRPVQLKSKCFTPVRMSCELGICRSEPVRHGDHLNTFPTEVECGRSLRVEEGAIPQRLVTRERKKLFRRAATTRPVSDAFPQAARRELSEAVRHLSPATRRSTSALIALPPCQISCSSGWSVAVMKCCRDQEVSIRIIITSP